MTTRVLVSRSRHDELVAKMKGFVEKIVKVGNPADPSVMLGPVIRAERRDAIEGHIASGREQGAELVTGGGRPRHLDRGFFIEPTIFGNVRNDMRIAREEIFGPVVSVIPFDDEAEALRIANDSDYGLFGGILTKDKRRAIDLARRIRTGGVSINGASNAFDKPSGGFKDSGIGRENGRFGLEAYTELQVVMWPN
jgi:aldehyde dehydrogenase (NAD+)